MTGGTRTATLTYTITAGSPPHFRVPLRRRHKDLLCLQLWNRRQRLSRNGTSPSTPWLTIAKVNSSTFNPGDTIEFHDGCTWREELNLPSPGTASLPITVSTYGSGSPPIISGSQVITSWTDEPQSRINFTSDHNLQAYWTMDQMSRSTFLDSTSNANTLNSINGVTQNTNHVQGPYSANFVQPKAWNYPTATQRCPLVSPARTARPTPVSPVADGLFDSSNANRPFHFEGSRVMGTLQGRRPKPGQDELADLHKLRQQ